LPQPDVYSFTNPDTGANKESVMKTAHAMLQLLADYVSATLFLSVAALVLVTGCLSQNENREEANNTVARPTTVDEIAVSARKQVGRTERISEYAPHAQALGRSAPLADMALMEYDLYADSLRHPSEPLNRENYAHVERNPVKLVGEEPVSTFSIDVDTGAYANVRRMLNHGSLPPQDAVRVEELINYFSYNYKQPDNINTPFSINMEMAPTPWNADTHLLQIGLQGYHVEAAERPATNLVFLLDVSGSMNSPDKLPLLKRSFSLLTRQMTADDRISIVVYAGASGVVLEPTPGNKKATIQAALDRLAAGGSTNGAAGIDLAYRMAEQGFIKNGINRVVLATDGDFNVGTVNFESLIDMVEERRKQGISLTTLGFGTGNYNDHLMEQLANKGNGNYAYIDNLNEARKVLVDELSSTLQSIAKDVKIQVEFNPRVVAEYRLIGYENRMLRREDFNNDRIDAGEIGAGHTVTALYEISLTGSKGQLMDPLRYANETDEASSKHNTDEVAFVRLRYKDPDADRSQLIERAVKKSDIVDLRQTSDELRFAAAVAAFGQRLRGGEYLHDFGYENIRQLANHARGRDEHGYRGEFIGLVNLADSLSVGADNAYAAGNGRRTD